MKLTRSRVAAILVLLLGSLGGCVVLPDRIDTLEARIVEVERREAELAAQEKTLERRIEELWSLFKAAKTELFKRGAETGANLEGMTVQNLRTAGSLEETQYRLERQTRLIQQIIGFVDRRFGVAIVDNTQAPGGQGKKSLLEVGLEHLTLGRMREARAAFQRYVDDNPDADDLGEARFGIAEAFRGEEDLAAAKKAYQIFYKEHGMSPRKGDALMRIAEILENQKKCKKAKQVYGLIGKEVPDSPQATEALARRGKMRERCSTE